MNPRERVLNAIELEDVDVIPYGGAFFSREVILNLFGETFLRGDPLSQAIFIARVLNSDVVDLAFAGYPAGPGIFEKIVAEGSDHIVASSPFGGILYWRIKPYFSLVLSGPVKDEEDLDSIEKPDVDQFMDGVKALRKMIERIHELGYFVSVEFKGPFESPWMYLTGGLVNFLKMVTLKPRVAEKSIELAFSTMLDLMDLVMDETEVDAIYITDDLGDNTRPFISPEKYRKLVKPWHREAADRVHRKGCKLWLHSHGNIMILFEDIVETGADVIEPLDVADGMKPAELKEKYGDKVCLCGGITKNIGYMSVEELERHIDEVFSTLGPTGFIAREAGGIPTEMTLESFNEYMTILHKRRGLWKF